MKLLRLIVLVDVDPEHRSPLELREHFLEEIRAALARAVGRADVAILNELWRALPEREPNRI